MFNSEVLAKAGAVIASGATIYFKFTCAYCGARQTFDVPNTLYTTGRCEECGGITDLETPEANIGFLLTAQIGGER